MPDKLEFLCYEDKVTVLNPYGNVGVLTLWSRTDTVLKEIGSPPPEIAAVANLYGDGISQLLVNLLYNPQISTLYLVGNNRTDSATELYNYFVYGTEKVKIGGSAQHRIVGTTRLVNEAVADSAMFHGRAPVIVRVYEPRNGTAMTLPEQVAWMLQRIEGSRLAPLPPPQLERITVKLIEMPVSTFPSIRQGHQVVADGPLDAWGEALFLLQRYGLPTTLTKGDRKELQNLKVVITRPEWATGPEYAAYNLDEGKLRAYCEAMLSPVLDADTSYTYGHRLYEYFGSDMIAHCVRRLKADSEDRKCYLSLWDPSLDLYDHNADGSKRGHPCWVGAFFRVFDGALTLSATFRTHRAYTAWVENAHGLMELQRTVAGCLGLPMGPLTIVSHSISIDPGQLSLVDSIVKARKWRLRDDGRGEVTFSISEPADGGPRKAVVEHRMGGMVLHRYESANIEALGHHLAQDHLVSDLNHALYVGRQLGKLQMCLKLGLPYDES